MLLAEIWTNVKVKSINQTYTYIVPEKLKHITAGWRVMVPFGGQKIDGFVIKIYEGNPKDFEFELKTITEAIKETGTYEENSFFTVR